jgi:hypothetical protein
MALKKEVHSDFSMDYLQKLVPIQNGGTSAKEIARISKQQLLFGKFPDPKKGCQAIKISSKLAINQ